MCLPCFRSSRLPLWSPYFAFLSFSRVSSHDQSDRFNGAWADGVDYSIGSTMCISTPLGHEREVSQRRMQSDRVVPVPDEAEAGYQRLSLGRGSSSRATCSQAWQRSSGTWR